MEFQKFPVDFHLYGFQAIPNDFLVKILSNVNPKKYKSVDKFFYSLSNETDFIVEYYHNTFSRNSLGVYLKDQPFPDEEVIFKLKRLGAFTVWTEQIKIAPSNLEDESNQGISVAVASDGNTLAFGNPLDDKERGSVLVYIKLEDGNWEKQAKISSPDSHEGSNQGSSVALASNGNTLAFGGPEDNGEIGAVWVYIRSENGDWIEQAKISSAVLEPALQGYSVALASNGDMLAFGGPDDDDGRGVVWIYIRLGNGHWIKQAKISSDYSLIGSLQGSSVALTPDGNILAFGGSGDCHHRGAIWIYNCLPDGNWIEQAKIFSRESHYGDSIALTPDGNTLALGTSSDDSCKGAVEIYTHLEDGSWVKQTKISSNNYLGIIRQGYSVAFTSDGNTLAFGGPCDSLERGAVWIYVRSKDEHWVEQQRIQSNNSLEGSFQGESMALSSNGDTLVFGGSGDNKIGAIWVYTRK